MNINEQANFIWSIADLLRGDFKQSEYGKVILPFTVLRRFDCVLAPSKAKILEANKTLTVSNKRPIFKRMTGHDYYNVSQFDFEKLMDDSNAIEANLRDYINGFSEDVREIMDNFEIFGAIDRLSRANLLYLVVQRFAEIDMSDTQIDNLEMGYMFEELIRRFSEQSNETAGEHFTPREVIELMVEVLLDPDMDEIANTDGKVITILDPACGTGGMLSVAQNKMESLNSTTQVIPFGQELNPETYATCRSDMILKGNSLRADMQGNIPYWGAGNIVDYVDKALFDEELVLLGEDGAPFFDHTRPVAFHITEPIWANNHIHVLRIKENADPKYIVYVLNAVDYKEYINGAILNKLTQSAMNRIKIPLPPLSVQKKISKHLDKKVAAINALLTQKESLVTLLQEKRTTTINNAVTRGIKTTAKMYESSVEWLGEVPENWRIVPAKALFAQSKETRHETDVQLTASQKYGIISQEDYMEKQSYKIVLADKGLENWKHVEPNDFIISLRSFQGGLEISYIPGCITWHYIVLKPKVGVEPEYFKWLFKSPRYIQALQRTANFIRDGQDLRFSNFVQVPLPLIPMDEQKEIAEYLNKETARIDSIIADITEQIEKLKEYRQSVISEVVTGKVAVE